MEEATTSRPESVFASDHNPLQWMRKQPGPRGTFGRLLLELESIDYEVENVAADYLSRTKVELDQTINDEEEFLERHVFTISQFEISFEWIKRKQMEDMNCRQLLFQLEAHGRILDGQFKKVRGMQMIDGGLFRDVN